MSDGTLFGLIHGLKDRTRARQIRDAQRNYLADPEEAILQVNEIDPGVAIDMSQGLQDRRFQEATAVREQGDADATRYRSALTNMVSGLNRVQQDGGDLGGAFDRLAPVMQQGFQMQPEEVAQWREQITTNPQFLGELSGFMTGAQPPAELTSARPGDWVYDPTSGDVRFRVPQTVRPQVLNRGDGGEDLYIIDSEGNFVQSGPTPAGGQGGTAAPSGGGLGEIPTNFTRRELNPQALGMRNNNPGNLEDGPFARRQAGHAGSDGRFARFATMEEGIAAQETLLRNHYVNGQRSVTDIVLKYLGGPNNPENSTASQRNYIGYVASQLGIDPGQPVPPEMLSQLGQAMREFENGGGPARGGSQGGAPRPAASTPGRPADDQGWRALSPADRAQYPNLDPNREYQIGVSGATAGQVREIPGQARPRAAGTGPNGGAPGQLTLPQHQTTVSGLERIRDEARTLINHEAFDQATGAIDGLLPSFRRETVDFDSRLDTFVSNSVINTILTMKQESPNGATGFGALNATEGNWIKESEGSFNRRSPEALRDALQRHERDAQISIGMAFNIPPEAVAFLLQRPNTAAQFDERYGRGMARRIMGE